MSNAVIKELEQEQIEKAIKFPEFKAGDTVAVKLKVKEGNRERLQTFEGIVIAKRNRGLNSAFTVRKISQNIGVERVFQTYSQQIHSVEVKRHGDVNKSKIYYLRELSGRKARIKEKIVRKTDAERAAAKASKAEKKKEAKKAAPKKVAAAKVEAKPVEVKAAPEAAKKAPEAKAETTVKE